MSIPSLPSGHCNTPQEFLTGLESFKEVPLDRVKDVKKIFNRFLVENEEYMDRAPKLIADLCKRFTLMAPQFAKTFKDIPEDVQRLILEKLGERDLSTMTQVSKSLESLASDESLWAQFAFGKAQWAKHLGIDVGVEPPLPKDLQKILSSPCPVFGHGKKVGETHMLVLIPKTINGEPLTLNSLKKIMDESMKDRQSTLDEIISMTLEVADKFGDKEIDESCWVLMTKDPIPESLNKNYLDQQTAVKDLSERTKLPYKIPKALEAAACIFTRYISSDSKTKPFENSLIRCQESIFSKGQVTIAGATPTKKELVRMDFFNSKYAITNLGVAVLRRL